MEEEPKDLMVLGAITRGAKKFDKISKTTKIPPQKLNQMLERLEQRGLIRVEEKKGLFGKKIEILVTEKGQKELENRIHELQENWNQISALYKSGDKQKLKQQLEGQKSFLPTMMFFGIMDMMMFSMMFSMIGASMTDYVPAEDIPSDIDGVDDVDSEGMDDGGFDIDIGF